MTNLAHPIRQACLLALIALAGFPATVRAQDCGSPPVHVEVSSDFRRHWTLFTCSQMRLGAGATVPIEGVPVTFSMSEEERRCTDSSETVEDHRRAIMTYLATRQSLLIAECGYRLCQMRRAHADTALTAAFTNMCGMGFADTSGPGAPSIGLESPLLQREWRAEERGQAVTVTVSVRNHNPGARLRYRAGLLSASGEIADATSGQIQPGATASVTIRLRVPSAAPTRARPTYLPFRIRIEGTADVAPAEVAGTVMFYRSADDPELRYCTRWDGDSCVRCEIPLSEGAQAGSCAAMPAGAARVEVSGVAVARGRGEDHDTWLEIVLEDGGQRVGWCNTGGGSSIMGRQCEGPFSGQGGVRRPSLLLGSVPVSSAGRVDASVRFQRCTSLGDGDTGCTLRGRMTIVAEGSR